MGWIEQVALWGRPDSFPTRSLIGEGRDLWRRRVPDFDARHLPNPRDVYGQFSFGSVRDMDVLEGRGHFSLAQVATLQPCTEVARERVHRHRPACVDDLSEGTVHAKLLGQGQTEGLVRPFEKLARGKMVGRGKGRRRDGGRQRFRGVVRPAAPHAGHNEDRGGSWTDPMRGQCTRIHSSTAAQESMSVGEAGVGSCTSRGGPARLPPDAPTDAKSE